ncbi:hypothetical protein Plhal304r1_c007g0029961 [Plasmopara halstedii]
MWHTYKTSTKVVAAKFSNVTRIAQGKNQLYLFEFTSQVRRKVNNIFGLERLKNAASHCHARSVHGNFYHR